MTVNIGSFQAFNRFAVSVWFLIVWVGFELLILIDQNKFFDCSILMSVDRAMIQNSYINKLLGFGLVTAVTGFNVNAQDQPVEVTSNLLWESRYVDSGRDDLGEGGLLSLDAVVSFSGFEAGLWYGVGDDEDYQELNFFVGYGFSISEFDVSLAYTRLEFEPDSANDDELSAEVGTSLWERLDVGVATVYSFEADGSFVEFYAAYPMEFLESKLLLEPSLVQGFDFGYRTESHDGVNHFQVGLDWEYVLCENFSLMGYVAHSFAMKDITREGLGDVSWIGIGTQLRF